MRGLSTAGKLCTDLSTVVGAIIDKDLPHLTKSHEPRALTENGHIDHDGGILFYADGGMKQFDILNRAEDLSGSCLVEASAGTGKTHSIENIVVRLLIDTTFPLALEKILVVTFTRAATEDLKVRIRENIFKMSSFCKRKLEGQTIDSIPDYLQAVFDQGEQAIFLASKRLEQGLIFFDRAQIFTIHAFCHRMLKEFVFEGHFPVVEREISTTEIYELIRDFFRTEVNAHLVTPQQLQRVLTHFKGIEQLEKKLFSLSMGGFEITPEPPLETLLRQFHAAMETISRTLAIQPEWLLEDFRLLAPAYKEICDAKKQPKPENIAKIKSFAALLAKTNWDSTDFDLLLRDGVYWLKVFHVENRDKRKTPPAADSLHYPELVSVLERTLGPVIEQARNSDRILATLAFSCRKMIKAYFEQEGILHFDNILDGMLKALHNDVFVEKVQRRFPVAVIDEFQDTDPIQWEIFKTLFLARDIKQNHKSRLYLVGDPKQSIYAFRQADIYTYLDAAEILGREKLATLSVNYRSTTKLIEALNYLFSQERIAGLMVLPRLSKTISYSAVKSSTHIMEKDYGDGRAAVNFFAVEGVEKQNLSTIEEEYFFPFIAQELKQMHQSGVLHFGHCAILVADRFQAERVGEYLKKRGIPFEAQRNKSIVATIAFPALRELLEGVLNPKHESVLKLALGGPICAWNEDDLSSLDDLEYREHIVARFLELRRTWLHEGFAAFFFAFLNFRFHSKEATIVETLLSTDGGGDFYHALDQIAALLSEEENRRQLSPHQLIDYFEELEKREFDGEGATRCISDATLDAVSILTIHSSKGLEFDVVFALGLMKKGKKPDFLVPVPRSGQRAQLEVVASESDPRYTAFCQELDAEKIRQLYVAWTRAKQRVYIPLLLDAIGRRQETASSMELYLSLLKQNGAGKEAFPELLLGRPLFPGEELLPVLKSLEHSLAYIRLEAAPAIDLAASPPEKTVLIPPPQPHIPVKPEILSSFTAYASKFNPKSDHQSHSSSPPRDFDVAEKSVHTLPAGMETGILLHAIFESIPFSIINKGPRNPLLTGFIEGFISAGPFAAWVDVLSDIIYHTWTASFPLGDACFSLQALEEGDTYREHGFLYPASAVPALPMPEGYLKGVIDMVFRYRDKYYIVDWKSNWLGPDSKSYQYAGLCKAMEEGAYAYQAKIYATALQRYLALSDPRPFEEIFGGSFYLFLRGLTPSRPDGIFLVAL